MYDRDRALNYALLPSHTQCELRHKRTKKREDRLKKSKENYAIIIGIEEIHYLLAHGISFLGHGCQAGLELILLTLYTAELSLC